jgi:hypothetical protein
MQDAEWKTNELMNTCGAAQPPLNTSSFMDCNLKITLSNMPKASKQCSEIGL